MKRIEDQPEVAAMTDVPPLPTQEQAGPNPMDGPLTRKERSRTSRLAADSAVGVFLLLMIVAFSIALPDQFPTWANVQTVLGSQAVPALLALAVIVPLVAGEFDLSVAATLGVTAVFTAYATSRGMSPGVVLLLGLCIGALVGVVNGLLVTRVGVSAFIATLGMATILGGANLFMTNGSVIFQNIPESLTNLARNSVFGLPVVVFYALIAAFILWYALEWTPFGRYLRATGSGREAARLSGVKTERWLFLSFVLAGMIAAFAGFMQTARTGSAVPTVGPDFLLPAYAAAFLGATTIHSGRFNVWGTIVGVLVLAVGINGLNLAGVPFWVPPVFNGAALIVAVSFAAVVGRRNQARAS